MRSNVLVLTVALLLGGPVLGANDFVIQPGVRVGPMTKDSSEDDGVRLLSEIEPGCAEIGPVHGKGKTNEDAIVDLKRNTAAMGGNAAYMLGGSATMDPTTKEASVVSNAGFAYKCQEPRR